MDHSKIPDLLKEIKKVLKSKGIKFQHLSVSCIVTRTYAKDLHPIIFSIDLQFPNRVTVSTVPLSNWQFTTEVKTVPELILKSQTFSQTVKSLLYVPGTQIKKP